MNVYRIDSHIFFISNSEFLFRNMNLKINPIKKRTVCVIHSFIRNINQILIEKKNFYEILL